MWGRKSYSGKWHLVKDIIEVEVPVNPWNPDGPKKKAHKALFDCAGSGYRMDYHYEFMALKEELNLFRSGICYYCRNRRLKELNQYMDLKG